MSSDAFGRIRYQHVHDGLEAVFFVLAGCTLQLVALALSMGAGAAGQTDVELGFELEDLARRPVADAGVDDDEQVLCFKVVQEGDLLFTLVPDISEQAVELYRAGLAFEPFWLFARAVADIDDPRALTDELVTLTVPAFGVLFLAPDTAGTEGPGAETPEPDEA